ncbi:MAG: response regulator [Bacteroidota bacterium]
MKTDRPILMVEDDSVDAMTIKRSFRELGIKNPIVHAKNGEEAFQYLRDESHELPAFILLDLNMPKMNGHEFLQERWGIDRLRTIPVIVLTTSKDEYDRLESFKRGIAGYMVKPIDYQQFVNVIKIINQYWEFSEIVH